MNPTAQEYKEEQLFAQIKQMLDNARRQIARMIPNLSKRLMTEYGGGFTITNLKVMKQFYLLYPKGHALRDQLSWTHWRTLLRVQNEAARNYYISECAAENWSTRQQL